MAVIDAQLTGPPTLIPVARRFVTTAGEPRSGTVVLKLVLYAAADDGTPIWVKDQLVALDAAGGYQAWVRLDAARRAAAASVCGRRGAMGRRIGRWEPEASRTEIESQPYASKAAAADRLGGKATDFVLSENLRAILRAWGVPMADTTAGREAATSGALQTLSDPLTSTPNALVKYLDTLGTEGASAGHGPTVAGVTSSGAAPHRRTRVPEGEHARRAGGAGAGAVMPGHEAPAYRCDP